MVRGDGNLLVAIKATIVDGIQEGAGSTVINNNAVLDLTGATPNNTGFALLQRNIENNGTINWINSFLTISTGGFFVNNGTFNIQGAQAMWDMSDPATPAKFLNHGTTDKTSTGTSHIGIKFINYATLKVQSGELVFNRDLVQSDESPGTPRTELKGNLTVYGWFNIEKGIVEVLANCTIKATTFWNDGTLRMSGANPITLTIDGVFAQGPNGVYESRIMGNNSDQLNVLGAFNMGGKLKVIVTTPPNAQKTYEVVKYASRPANSSWTTELPNLVTAPAPGATEATVVYTPA